MVNPHSSNGVKSIETELERNVRTDRKRINDTHREKNIQRWSEILGTGVGATGRRIVMQDE